MTACNGSERKQAAEYPQGYLVVPSMNTYFVGRTGLLVHDNLFREPTTALIPGFVKAPQSVSQP